MSNISRNRVLRWMSEEGRAALEPHITVTLGAREVLQEQGMPTLYVYFPLTAIVATMTTMERGETAEVALIGHEGMVGLPGILGCTESPTAAMVQIPGTAIRVRTTAVRAARDTHPDVRSALDAYTEATLMQMAQTAGCNRLHSVQQRLARLLLAIQQRIDGDAFVLPQEAIAHMLGVHRPTVAVALQRLQDYGAIRRRGRTIVVSDSAAVQELACECHRVLDREFERSLSRNERTRKGRTVTAVVPTGSEPTAAAALESLREIAGRLLITGIHEQEQREEAENAKRSIESLLAMVSHELRTPLNAIIGWCALLRMQTGAGDARALEVIERNANAQLRIVDDLLDAARVTAATLTLQPTLVDVRELGQEVVDAIRPTADAKGIALRLSMTDHLPAILGDRDRLRQVLLNLLTNAIKFTDAGGAIEVSAAELNDGVQVVVRDTGRGIPHDTLPHVFERFRQGPDIGASHQGLGLGLTIARALVELHGGHIELASGRERAGTTCTIYLPLVSAEADLTFGGSAAKKPA
jgi:signal transduction histidine kinase